MDYKNFEELLVERLYKIKNSLAFKSKEYATEHDKLRNFKLGAKILRNTPHKTLLGYFTKHMVSIVDIVENYDGEQQITEEFNKIIDEKIGDAINYLILLEALFKEKEIKL